MMKLDGNNLDIAKEKVSFRTNIDELAGVPESVVLIIKDNKGKTFEIDLNVNQAEAIMKILTAYTQCFYLYRVASQEAKEGL